MIQSLTLRLHEWPAAELPPKGWGVAGPDTEVPGLLHVMVSPAVADTAARHGLPDQLVDDCAEVMAEPFIPCPRVQGTVTV